jgi:hypothetical protein
MYEKEINFLLNQLNRTYLFKLLKEYFKLNQSINCIVLFNTSRYFSYS